MRSNLLWLRPTVYPLLATLLVLAACRQPAQAPAPPPARPDAVRGTWTPPDAVEVGSGSTYPFGLSLAPDGRHLVFPAARAGRVALWLQNLSTGETRELPATDGAAMPFWSPDGLRVGFLAQDRLHAIELASGSVTALADAPGARGASWNQSGDLVFAVGSGGLQRRSADGTLAPFTTLDPGESTHAWPAFLPDGKHVAYLVEAAERSRAGIWLTSIHEPTKRARIAPSDAQPVIAGQTLLLLNDTTLLAQPLNPTTWLADGRSTLAGLSAGRGPQGQLLATAAADVLIYGAPGSRLRELKWLSPAGETLGRAGEPAESWDLRIAPDGRRVAVTQLDPQLRTLDVWIRDGNQPVPTRLSLGTDIDESAAWSPDGLRVAWIGKRRNLLIRGAGAVLPEQTSATFDPPVQLWDWSRDGRFLLIGRTDAQTKADLWVLPQVPGGTPGAYSDASFNQTHGAFSPNGRWLAYVSDESGQPEIYIDSFPKPGTRLRVTTAGGTEPRWKGDGTAVYFRRGSEVHVVRLAAKLPALEVASIDRLFDAGAAIRSFDVTPDGSRFLINVPAADAAPRSATLVVHWQGNASRGNTEARKP